MKQFILMADVISSGEKDQNQLMIDFKDLVEDINKSYKEKIISPLTITLGDEFQGVIVNLEALVGIVISLEENIIHKKFNFKLRYVMLEGEIETPINKKIAYEMLGVGLTDARYKLNQLKLEKLRFGIFIDDKLQNEILKNAFLIFDGITRKWSLISDYELVSSFIKFSDYKIIAELMSKTRSQIWKREKTLNIESYNSAKKIIYLITENK